MLTAELHRVKQRITSPKWRWRATIVIVRERRRPRNPVSKVAMFFINWIASAAPRNDNESRTSVVARGPPALAETICISVLAPISLTLVIPRLDRGTQVNMIFSAYTNWCMSSYKSRQSGLYFSIKSFFQLRFHSFKRFSWRIAILTSLNFSTYTNLVTS